MKNYTVMQIAFFLCGICALWLFWASVMNAGIGTVHARARLNNLVQKSESESTVTLTSEQFRELKQDVTYVLFAGLMVVDVAPVVIVILGIISFVGFVAASVGKRKIRTQNNRKQCTGEELAGH